MSEEEPKTREEPRNLRSYLEKVNNELAQQETEDTDKAILDDMEGKLFSEDPNAWGQFVKKALEGDNMLKHDVALQKMIESRIEPLRESDDPDDKRTLGVLMAKLGELTVVH